MKCDVCIFFLFFQPITKGKRKESHNKPIYLAGYSNVTTLYCFHKMYEKGLMTHLITNILRITVFIAMD